MLGHETLAGIQKLSPETETALRADHQLGRGGSLDESTVALVDTACTSCMHSRRWRLAFEKHLPEGWKCIKTNKTKRFHFADGSDTGEPIDIWILPVAFPGGNAGQIYSAEVPTGTTPLLLSISCMEALDMDLKMKKRKICLNEFKVTCDMLITRTNHRAIPIACFDELHKSGIVSKYHLEDGGKKREPAVKTHTEAIPKSVARSLRTKPVRYDKWSLKKDLYIYFLGEADGGYDEVDPILSEDEEFAFLSLEAADSSCAPPLFAERGVRREDKRTEMPVKRQKELEEVALRVSAEDTHMWRALRKSYSNAEAFASRNFTKTMVFEPWGGSYRCTRLAAKKYGWTCSQPLDKLDGYDLLTKRGKQLLWDILDKQDPWLTIIAFDCRIWSVMTNMNPDVDWENLRQTLGREVLRLVRAICLHRHKRGRFVLVEQPAGAASWVYDMLLLCVLELPDFKFVLGDQCPYNKRDAESGKLQRKRSGYLSNSERIINVLGVQCSCPPGTHELILGSNASGHRSAQAAEYTWEFCAAILWATYQDMKVEYAISKSFEVSMLTDAAFPAGDDDEEVNAEYHDYMEELAGKDEPMPPVEELPIGEPAVAPGEGIPEAEAKDEAAPKSVPLRAPKRKVRAFTRTRATRQGYWSQIRKKPLMKDLITFAVDGGDAAETLLPVTHELGDKIVREESAEADVKLILISKGARRMKKPQPHASAAEVPYRNSFIIQENEVVISTGWEEWRKLSPASQVKLLPSVKFSHLITLFGDLRGGSAANVPADRDTAEARDMIRQRQWDALPRELKMAIRRVHENLGHARKPDMLRALRISRASAQAIRAARLFKCSQCPRLEQPKIPRPSRLPQIDEFNVMVGFDVFEEKDADGCDWTFLSMLCLGASFHVVVLLAETNKNPDSSMVLEMYAISWENWAGMPERGVIVDRAKYFLARFSEALANEGCIFEAAAKASPWHIGKVERHGGIWKSMFRKIVYAKQVSGRDDVILAVAETNKAKNSLARRSGFSPQQWVIGRDIRLPADLMDDGEVSRLQAQAVASTPTTRFFRKAELRQAAREAFAQAGNDEALRKAEIGRIRPTRGPFRVGEWVFYYDPPGEATGYQPTHWRGMARVVGHEGTHTVWLSHRGLMLACSPEQLSHADDEEVRAWMVTSAETELVGAQARAGGNQFVDLRGKAKPPQPEEPDASQPAPASRRRKRTQQAEEKKPEESSAAPVPEPTAAADLPSGSDVPSDATEGQLEGVSDKALKRAMARSQADQKKYDFFRSKIKAREARQARMNDQGGPASSSRGPDMPVIAEDPLENADDRPAVDMEYDPEQHDYHQLPAAEAQDLHPRFSEVTEQREREAKRQRVTRDEGGSYARAYHIGETEVSFAFMAAEVDGFLDDEACAYYQLHSDYYQSKDVSQEEFLFGQERNLFDDKYQALAHFDGESAFKAAESSKTVKKQGRKEIKLSELSSSQKQLFVGPGGSDEKEWQAWLDYKACEVASLEDSLAVRKNNSEDIVPTRWVRTNKNDGLVDEDFLAKSRLVVQGFKDRALGMYRRDAPTASSLAEAMVLLICAVYQFTLFGKDVKNGYFNGKDLQRLVYLDQPRGGLPGLKPGQLLVAKKAIYGFAEAARLFWLALREALISDGWRESRLEPATFTLRIEDKKPLLAIEDQKPEASDEEQGGPSTRLAGVLLSHVDDLEGGTEPGLVEKAFEKTSLVLTFGKSSTNDFVFRGREVRQLADGDIEIKMRNYALSMKTVTLSKERSKQLKEPLNEAEDTVLRSGAGELQWLTRQLRHDLAFENGCVQRCREAPCVADLVRLRHAVRKARRGADFRQRFWHDIDLHNCVVVHLADSGHVNGTPENDDIKRYRSIGGFFLVIANPEVLDGKPARAVIMESKSGLTKRVCRSTLAAEAGHLADAVEHGDWLIVFLQEMLDGYVDLRNWEQVVSQRKRVYVTDARSVYDYLSKDGTSTSSDKRMAIEGALLRETVKRPNAHVRWIDGLQNIADILTKFGADEEVFKQFMRDGLLCLTQTEANKKTKEKKQAQRAARKKVTKSEEEKSKKRAARRQQAADTVALQVPNEDDD